jgi:hypothetical protein
MIWWILVHLQLDLPGHVGACPAWLDSELRLGWRPRGGGLFCHRYLVSCQRRIPCRSTQILEFLYGNAFVHTIEEIVQVPDANAAIPACGLPHKSNS